jgi:hypothetical protein
MSRDYDSFLQSMKLLIPNKLPEWTDYNSEADFGNVLLQLFAHMGDILSYYQDRIANESYLGTAQTRRSIIHHLRLIGYNLSTAAPASTKLTISFTVKDTDKIITISRGDAFATKSQKDKSSIRFEYNQETPFKIDLKDYDTGDTCVSEISVEEGRLIEDEILGTSDASANQRFPLAHSPLILRSQGQNVNKDIILTAEYGDTIEEWKVKENLAFSRKDLKDYSIEIDENDKATVVFGDGEFGSIPTSGAVIKATYRVGGGLAGNVPKKTITTIVDAPQLAILAASVTNPESASGGAECESIEHAVFHAPEVFRSLKRAVTLEDYEALALKFTGVGKVRAEALNWNIVNLYVAPEGGGQASDLLTANLLAYFEGLRPVSTLIEIENVDYVQIKITAEIGIERYYSLEDLKAKTKEVVTDLLAFDNVNFGDTIYLSKFYEEIENIQGIKYVNISEFERDHSIEGEESDGLLNGKIILGSNEIPCVPSDAEYSDGCKIVIEED